MAGFEQSKDIYDVALKPRMLRSLIKQYLPDASSFNTTCFELPKLVSVLQTHRLLSESSTQSMDQKVIDHWKSAVDDWVSRLFLLLSSDMSDKCWVGISLLGVTCQQCRSDRFLMSYQEWFNKLLSHIQQPLAGSQLVKVASCTSLSDLFTRLARFPEVKKGGNELAGKLVQPVLKLLNDDSGDALSEGAASLLYTIITFFPISVRSYYDRAEAAIASKILSGEYSTNTLKKLGYCLASLPKSKGDKDSWYVMMQKILLRINDHLNDAFQGVEEEAKADEAKRLLVPPGKDLPSPLGHTSLVNATQSSERLSTSTVSALIFCSCKMLTSSYPVQVNAPVRAMLALVERLLVVDGSLPHAMLPFATALQQELICSDLPVLHAYSLDLLVAIIKGMRSQLLPHAAYVVRLVTRYFRRCTLPELRIKLYSISSMLLISMGVGMAIYLAPDVIENVFYDLNSLDDEDFRISLPQIRPSAGAFLQPCNRKRKHGTETGYLEEKQGTTGSEVEAANMYQMTPLSVKIAALDTLEVLLTVGGATKSEGWRSSIDCLLIKTAINSCKRGWANEENNIFLHHESTSIMADFQLSSLRALLASLLSPSRVRPPYLAQGLELFRTGKQEAGTKLAGFCAHALLALEVLIHPRALPLDDFPSTYLDSADGAGHRFPENIYSSSQKHSKIFSNSLKGTEQSALQSKDDDLYERWLDNQNENEIIPSENTREKISRSCLAEEPQANDSSLKNVSATSEQDPATADVDVVMRSEDGIMVEPSHIQESIPESQEIVSAKGVSRPAVARNPEGSEIESKVSLAGDGSNYTNHKTLPRVVADKGHLYDNVHGSTFSTLSKAEKGDLSMPHLNSESSMDSLPGIVDADPDTDSD